MYSRPLVPRVAVPKRLEQGRRAQYGRAGGGVVTTIDNIDPQQTPSQKVELPPGRDVFTCPLIFPSPKHTCFQNYSSRHTENKQNSRYIIAHYSSGTRHNWSTNDQNVQTVVHTHKARTGESTRASKPDHKKHVTTISTSPGAILHRV